MASTELRRKAQRNRTRAKDKVQAIKRLNATPVIKKVDVEELKAQFGGSKKSTPKKAEKEEVKAEAPAVEETVVAETKTEKKAPAKKAASKKEKEA